MQLLNDFVIFVVEVIAGIIVMNMWDLNDINHSCYTYVLSQF